LRAFLYKLLVEKIDIMLKNVSVQR
jgi:hypothetical protein